jgi:hypothetical protein
MESFIMELSTYESYKDESFKDESFRSKPFSSFLKCHIIRQERGGGVPLEAREFFGRNGENS